MQIVEQYYSSTPNEENKDKQLSLGNSTGTSENLSVDSSNQKLKLTQPEKVLSVVDASILMHVLEFVCVLLKNTPANTLEFKSIIFQVFPDLLTYVRKSDDMFLLLHGTTTLKNFVFCGHLEILKIVQTERIIETVIKLLQPTTNE